MSEIRRIHVTVTTADGCLSAAGPSLEWLIEQARSTTDDRTCLRFFSNAEIRAAARKHIVLREDCHADSRDVVNVPGHPSIPMLHFRMQAPMKIEPLPWRAVIFATDQRPTGNDLTRLMLRDDFDIRILVDKKHKATIDLLERASDSVSAHNPRVEFSIHTSETSH